MKKKLGKPMKKPSEVNYSKEEIIGMVLDLKKKDWVTLPEKRAGRDGGTGNYIENDVFMVEENNEQLPDLGTYELKTHGDSDALNTLKSIEPGPKKRNALITPIVRDFGWETQPQCPLRMNEKNCTHKEYDPNNRCYPVGTRSGQGIDMCDENSEIIPNPRGFYTINNKEEKRIEMHFDSKRIKMDFAGIREWVKELTERHGSIEELDLDPNCYWPYDTLKAIITKKLGKVVWIEYQTNEDKTKFKVTDAYFYEEFDIEKFVNGLDTGELQIEIRAYSPPPFKKSRNHGTAFRMFDRNIPNCYGKTEKIE